VTADSPKASKFSIKMVVCKLTYQNVVGVADCSNPF
jgi:hypothetical protein